MDNSKIIERPRSTTIGVIICIMAALLMVILTSCGSNSIVGKWIETASVDENNVYTIEFTKGGRFYAYYNDYEEFNMTYIIDGNRVFFSDTDGFGMGERSKNGTYEIEGKKLTLIP